MTLLSAFRVIQRSPPNIITQYRFMSSLGGNLAHFSKGALNGDRSNLIPFSSRLRGGRALAQDVWSIYK